MLLYLQLQLYCIYGRIFVTVIFVRILYCIFVVVVVLLEIDDKTRQINNTHTAHVRARVSV